MVATVGIAAIHGSFSRIRQVAPTRIPSNTWFPAVHAGVRPLPDDVLIGSAVFARLSGVTDRQTDRQTDRAATRHL